MSTNPESNVAVMEPPGEPKPRNIKPAPFKFQPFSTRQAQVMTWWRPESPYHEMDGIICDGSIRAGKTVVMSLSYVMFVMSTFDGEKAGMAGKTIASFRRNVISPLKKMLKSRGYFFQDHKTENYMTVRKNGKENHFYIFGGKDEASQDLVQGITLCSFFFDEVALMPESFVTQAEGRCSVEGAKLWYNCNPGSPFHWFKLERIDKRKKLKLLRLHFRMEDNLSLSDDVKEKFYRRFTGIFYSRYILGLWVMAEGVVYDMFDKKKHVLPSVPRFYSEFYVSIDYGTQNPTTFNLWGKMNEKTWVKVKEYEWDGRKQNRQKTDYEYFKDLKQFMGKLPINAIIIDPSAASFIAQCEAGGLYVIPGNNNVLEGIRNMQTALRTGLAMYNDRCTGTFKEFGSYSWDPKAAQRGEDKPLKANDHFMDGDRYFFNTIVFAPRGGISNQNVS